MDIIGALQSKDNRSAYALLLSLEGESAQSDKYYPLFEQFLALTHSESSLVRVRGFRLCCAQAQWDKPSKLEANMDELLQMLDDPKPAAVRQCLAALPAALLYKPDLADIILPRLNGLSLAKYSASMRPLIEKDVAMLKDAMR